MSSHSERQKAWNVSPARTLVQRVAQVNGRFAVAWYNRPLRKGSILPLPSPFPLLRPRSCDAVGACDLALVHHPRLVAMRRGQRRGRHQLVLAGHSCVQTAVPSTQLDHAGGITYACRWWQVPLRSGLWFMHERERLPVFGTLPGAVLCGHSAAGPTEAKKPDRCGEAHPPPAMSNSRQRLDQYEKPYIFEHSFDAKQPRHLPQAAPNLAAQLAGSSQASTEWPLIKRGLNPKNRPVPICRSYLVCQ